MQVKMRSHNMLKGHGFIRRARPDRGRIAIAPHFRADLGNHRRGVGVIELCNLRLYSASVAILTSGYELTVTANDRPRTKDVSDADAPIHCALSCRPPHSRRKDARGRHRLARIAFDAPAPHTPTAHRSARLARPAAALTPRNLSPRAFRRRGLNGSAHGPPPPFSTTPPAAPRPSTRGGHDLEACHRPARAPHSDGPATAAHA